MTWRASRRHYHATQIFVDEVPLGIPVLIDVSISPEGSWVGEVRMHLFGVLPYPQAVKIGL